MPNPDKLHRLSKELECFNMLKKLYTEYGIPISGLQVAKRLGCVPATAVKHLVSNPEKLEITRVLGRYYFKPKGM